MKNLLRKLLENPSAIVAASLVSVFAFGLLVGGSDDVRQSNTESMPQTANPASQEQRWTCAMHPQINLGHAGQCPLCGMDLVPVYSSATAAPQGRASLSMSADAARWADIQTVTARRKSLQAEIRLVGTIDFDESRLAYITAYFPGRLDRLYVDYTGVQVRKGDHLARIYSPELVTAQEELLQSLRAAKKLGGSANPLVREVSGDTVRAAREKLRLWGLSAEQIEEVERRGSTADDITIHSPISGVVIDKNAVEGMYVETGTRIYTLADLTHLWVKLDAYESDLPWLRYGEKVDFTTQSLPGETFSGSISFIDPTLSPETRTVKLRMNIDNPDRRLKPGMFVRAVARPTVGGGAGEDSPLAGKWVGPMHPEITSDGPGKCDICGMPLVRAEELGLVPAAADDRPPLVIPASAPLVTGKRAVVYVRVPESEPPAFEGREVVLGPRVGDHYIVVDGLAEGVEVVTKGAFKIDSALQIQARPSMMSPSGDDARSENSKPAGGHAH